MNILTIVPKVRCPKCGSKTLDMIFHIDGDYRYRCKNCNLYFWSYEIKHFKQKRLSDYE